LHGRFFQDLFQTTDDTLKCQGIFDGIAPARKLGFICIPTPGDIMRNLPFMSARPSLHRYALWLSRPHRRVLPEDDATALADLAAVRAWPRFDSSRGIHFRHFARRWVLGEIMGAIRQASRTPIYMKPTDHISPYAAADAACIVDELLAHLTTEQRHFILSHVVEEHSLSELARRVGRHRAWGTRRFKELATKLRAI
jgi:DNA-directed RNA polymerase specialized sigma24 family protein